MSKRKILVTYALTYANGMLHLGHMTGFIMTDIWVRFQKMLRNDCFFVCGCDAHGTPIMIKAEKSGVTPEALVESVRASHQQDLAQFMIDLDNYHTTHSPENRQLVEDIFLYHQKAGNIVQRSINQAYDPEKHMFLPDRLIKGTCPRCGAHEQYGDNCESCGATYAPTDLINPRSTLSGATPIEKESVHYFFRLTHYSDFLQNWTRAGHLQTEVTHKLDEWFSSGLKDWDISRDAPYFGFTIPGETARYFYCWLDAPVGYMASFFEYCNRTKRADFNEYWDKDSTTEVYHFIGKDIIYFHALFWPALLADTPYRTPTAIHTHGFLTINGQKMSKSRGTFIQANTFAEHIPTEYLRYYLAAHMTARIEDMDLQLTDFMQRINAELVGKFVNIASRAARFIAQYFNNTLAHEMDTPELFTQFAHVGNALAERYEKREFAEALREIMLLADQANQYIDSKKPWVLIKEADKQNETQAICTTALNVFRQLMIYLKPVLPGIAAEVEAFLNVSPLHWADKDQPLLAHRINTFVPLATRLTEAHITALQNAAAAVTA